LSKIIFHENKESRMELLCKLSEKGVKVYAVKGSYELNGNSLQSKVMTMVLCMASEIERDLISQRTKEALARKKKEGVKLGRPREFLVSLS
jgi:DNA invertase Pin-like site-specific DNA recombinase